MVAAENQPGGVQEAKKATRVLAWISTVACRSRVGVVPMYWALMRSHLEY